MDTKWLSKTTIKAHLDRLRFTLEPLTPTPRSELVQHIPRSRAHPRTHAPAKSRWDLRDIGGTGTRFEVTVHDPVSLAAVVDIVERLRVRLPLTREPELNILEIAMDVWPDKVGSVDLARVVADLFTGSKFEPSTNSRLVKGKGMVESVYGRDTIYRRLRDGYTVYNGNRDDDCMVRGYVKVTDNNAALPPAEHRARFEVQLQYRGLPVATVRELRSFKFEDLSPLFLMWTVAADLPPLAAMVAHSVPKLRRHPRIHRLPRVLSTCAFTPFNKRAYRALQRLTIAMQNQRRSPFDADHLLKLTDPSVSTDSFFHPPIDVTPSATGDVRLDPLTTYLVGSK